MKIKSLLIGMLACTALVGCSDDVIDNIAQENNEVQTKTKGYLSISIASGTSSFHCFLEQHCQCHHC